MTIRVTGRIAGLAVLAAEATAVARTADGPPPLIVWAVFLALQVGVVLWATDRRSSAALRKVAPAALTALAAAASWTALALALPVITTTDAAALVVVLGSGLVVATSHRGAGRRLLPLPLLAAAGSALLIFLVIGWFLPAVPGFVSNNHPPTYAPVTRLIDPIGELALSMLLALLLIVDAARVRTRIRRAAARDQRQELVAGPNEMVVVRTE